MDNKLNNAMNEIDEALIEEAAHAGSAERGGLRLARNIGLSVCGVAAAAAALTFGISHHMASLPEKVDLLPAESTEASGNISEAIMESALKELAVERVEVEDVDRARLSAYEPYFVEAGNHWMTFDDDGNILGKDISIMIMDCGGYWLQYDTTGEEGVIDELLDVRGALARAEDVLGASLTELRMGTYDLGGAWYTVTARFDSGKCLHYSLKCDTNHEKWTMTLLSDEEDFLDGYLTKASFFHEERSGVYDAVRFNDLGGAYICDNNGEIRVVEHTSEGYFGYLPFGGNEDIYTIENTETGSRMKYCVKENGDAMTTTADFLNVLGVEHQDDPQNVVLPAWSSAADDATAALPEIGAAEMHHLSYSPDYYGLALTFMTDKDGKVFLYDFSWLYPCTVEEVDDPSYTHIIKVNFYPEGRETPDSGYQVEVPMHFLVDGDTWTLDNDCDLFIDEQGKTKKITLYKGTEFSLNGGGMVVPAESDSNGQAETHETIDVTQQKINDIQAEIQKIQEMIGAKEQENSTLQAEIQKMQEMINQKEQEISYLQAEIREMQEMLNANEQEPTDLQAEIREMQEMLDANEQELTDLQAEIREMQEALSANEQELTDLQAELTDLQTGNQAMREAEQQELNERWAELIAGIPDPDFLYPVGGDYAIVEHVYGHSPDSGYYGHAGIDIGVDLGEPVLAAADGEVILAQWYYGYGNCVMIQHDNGVVTVYGHCSELYVSEGDTVTQGQTIAAAGATGQATEAHLHFEVRINDEWVDPALFEYRLANGEPTERITLD